MSGTFRDHFSDHAADYSQGRPTYPDALFDWLATLVPTSTHVWDCGTGNGQAAVALAARFGSVFATDASAEQIEAATAHDRVRYAVTPASKSGLPDHSVGLVTVAQALHWFDPEPFHREVARVLAPGGVIAAWCYELCTITPEVDAPMTQLYHRIVGADWPAERRFVEAAYGNIPWPWERLSAPDFVIEQRWSVERALAYFRTWSASRRYMAREGQDPVALVEEAVRAGWGDAETRPVRWPIAMVVSRP